MAMRYDLYKLDDHDEPQLWRSDVCVNELFRAFGFPRVKDKLRDLRHLEGTFLTAEMFLIPAGKPPVKVNLRSVLD
jgi:hypothetical protein